VAVLGVVLKKNDDGVTPELRKPSWDGVDFLLYSQSVLKPRRKRYVRPLHPPRPHVSAGAAKHELRPAAGLNFRHKGL